MTSPAHTDSATAAPRTPQRRTASSVSGYPQALSPRTMTPVERFNLIAPALHTVNQEHASTGAPGNAEPKVP